MTQQHSTGRRQDVAQGGKAAPGADCAGQEQVEQNLANFDRLDFEGWNGPDWDLFTQFHTADTHVEGFGTITDGIEPHVAWAQAFIAANPDTYKILSHPIRIGAGDWTAVTGVLQDGSTMATIARWENGQIVEEYLFSLMA